MILIHRQKQLILIGRDASNPCLVDVDKLSQSAQAAVIKSHRLVV